MIPKIIHYCWFGGKSLPKEVRKCIQSWKRNCPDYEIRQWDESNFDIHSHPFVESAYEEKAWAFVSDYVRLKVVYDCGGIYLDTDVELLKNLDFLLENQCYIGVQQGRLLCNTGLGFGAVKSAPVVLEMMEKYNRLLFQKDKKTKLACPALNHDVIERYGYQYSEKIWYGDYVTVYPCRYFDPYAPGKAENLMCGDTVSIHHYAASWTHGMQRMKRKFVRKVGEEKIDMLKKHWRRWRI